MESKTLWKIVAVGVACASTFALSAGSNAQTLQTLNLAYASTVPGSDSTFLFAGKQLGFFAEQGINLEIQPTGGTLATAALIASGAMDIGLGGQEGIPSYVERGLPMRSVYVYVYRPIFGLSFLPGSKVQSVASLRGAKIGVSNLASGAVPILQYLLAKEKMTLNDVQLTALGRGASAIVAIKGGEVDALMFDDSAQELFAANGISMTRYSDPRLESGYPGQGILALDRILNSKKSLVEGFLRGITKSLVYAARDPAGATAAFGKLYPEAAKNPALEELVWRGRSKIAVPVDSNQLGYMPSSGWDNLQDVLLGATLIKQKFPTEKIYTTDFLKAANSVDLSKLP